MSSNNQQNYFSVLSGNNSTAIKKALLKRGVWTELPADKEYTHACFHWQQLNYSHKKYQDFQELCRINPSKQYLLNHFEQNGVITTKSGLVKTLQYFYSHEGVPLSKHIFEAIPTTFIIKANTQITQSTQYKDFKEKFEQLEKKNFNREKLPQKHCQKNIWFIKPESNNQGKGIMLSNSLKQIESLLVSKPVNTGWIIQKAIQKPFLYNNRKFDIRVWVLVTTQFDVYYYNAPYIRTSSIQYGVNTLNTQVHLTNNCQQKKNSTQYSKYQEGNTLPFQKLRDYLLKCPEHMNSADLIMDKITSRMKQIIIDTMMCAKKHFQKKCSGSGANRRGSSNQFQLFGYDFLIDEDFRAWILQVNNNPYLGTPNTYIKNLIPLMIDQMLQLAVDPFYPPSEYSPVSNKRFQLLSKQKPLRQNFRINSNNSKSPTTNSIEIIRSKAAEIRNSITQTGGGGVQMIHHNNHQLHHSQEKCSARNNNSLSNSNDNGFGGETTATTTGVNSIRGTCTSFYNSNVSTVVSSNIRIKPTGGRLQTSGVSTGDLTNIVMNHHHHYHRQHPTTSTNHNSNPRDKIFRYSTPVQTLRYLLENYCYVDLDPFFTPVNFILSSERLTEESSEQVNVKTLKMIAQTRVASILLEQKFFKLAKNILLSQEYLQSIKIVILKGYENAAKNFKGKLFAIQKVVPVISTLLNRSLSEIGDPLIQQILRLQIKLGGFLEKVFIPGVTTQNQKLRKYFIQSNCFSLFLFLVNSYPEICQEQIGSFMKNLKHSDWDLFYDHIKNNGKRAYSPRSVTSLMKDQNFSFNITLHEIKTEHQESYSSKDSNSRLGKFQDKNFRNFRTRKQGAFPFAKK